MRFHLRRAEQPRHPEGGCFLVAKINEICYNKIMIASLTNTVDGQELRYPQSVRLRQQVESAWRKTARLYGYEEHDNDAVSSEHYSRRYQLVNGSFEAPIYNWATRMFRYDNVGCESPRADVEAIAIAKRSLDAIGLPRAHYRIRVNDARIVTMLMTEYLGLDTIQAELIARLLAQKRTLEPQEFRDRAIEIIGSERAGAALQQLAKLLVAKTAEDLPESVRTHQAYHELTALYERLETLGITGVTLDVTLSYPEYAAGIVFDIIESDSTHSALLYKGGRTRSDDLESSVMSLADMSHIVEALTHAGSVQLGSTTEVYIAAVGDVLDTAEKLAEKLRSEQVRTEVDYTGRTLDKQLKTAVKKRVTYLLILDEASDEKGLYTLRNLRTGDETAVSFERVVTAVSDGRYRLRDDDDDAFDLSEFLSA